MQTDRSEWCSAVRIRIRELSVFYMIIYLSGTPRELWLIFMAQASFAVRPCVNVTVKIVPARLHRRDCLPPKTDCDYNCVTRWIKSARRRGKRVHASTWEFSGSRARNEIPTKFTASKLSGQPRRRAERDGNLRNELRLVSLKRCDSVCATFSAHKSGISHRRPASRRARKAEV